MFTGFLPRIIFELKRDWRSGIANLFLLICLVPAALSVGAQVTDTAAEKVTDSAGRISFDTYSPLLDTVKTVVPLKKDSLLPGYLILLDSSLRVMTDSAGVREILRPFFAPHALKVKDYRLEIRKWSGNELPFVVLTLGFIFLAAAQFYYGKRLSQIVRACVNSRFLAQLIRNGDLYNEQISTYLFLIYIVSVPLLILEVNSYYLGIPIPGGVLGLIWTYLLILGAYAALYGIKILAIRFSGTIFKTYAATQEYILIIFVFNLLEGLLILFFLTAVIFTDSELIFRICLLTLGLVFSYRLFRAFFLGLGESKYSIFYLLLFFSTVEVLPVLILTRLLMNFFHA